MTNKYNSKILYVPSSYGENKSGFFGLINDTNLEKQILQIFQDKGFIIKRGMLEDTKNPNALGIHVDSLPYADISKHYEYYRFLIDKALSNGASMPKEFSWNETLTTDIPIVAKEMSSQRGDGKYLLKTYNEKMNFLVWAMNGQSYFWVEGDTPNEKLKSAQELCQRRRNFLETLLEEKENDNICPDFLRKSKEEIERVNRHYQFQEYIKSPTNKNSSYRVVVDAKGEVHYSALITSEFNINQYDMSNWGENPWDACDKNPYRFTTSIFLKHPNSPIHIPMYQIVSNRAQGGNAILLSSNSKHITQYSEGERNVLEAHGINPTNPQLPYEVINLSKKIAFNFRDGFPYGGADFIQNEKGDFLFLEYNYGPDMNPTALGLETDLDPNKVTLEMMKRVANKY